jgi:type IV pilus assembly protein PilX
MRIQSTASFHLFGQQRGVALVLSLLMLVAITLLAVTAMRGSTLQEKMAANLNDREIAKQVAEGTLLQVAALLPPAAGVAWFNAPIPAPVQGTADRWNNAAIWNNAGVVNVTVNGQNYNGQFLVENLGMWTSRQDPTCKVKENPLCERQTYRITVRNQPVAGRAGTMVQVVWRI